MEHVKQTLTQFTNTYRAHSASATWLAPGSKWQGSSLSKKQIFVIKVAVNVAAIPEVAAVVVVEVAAIAIVKVEAIAIVKLEESLSTRRQLSSSSRLQRS